MVAKAGDQRPAPTFDLVFAPRQPWPDLGDPAAVQSNVQARAALNLDVADDHALRPSRQAAPAAIFARATSTR